MTLYQVKRNDFKGRVILCLIYDKVLHKYLKHCTGVNYKI